MANRYPRGKLGSVFYDPCLHEYKLISWKWERCIRCNQWHPTPEGQKALASERQAKRQLTR